MDVDTVVDLYFLFLAAAAVLCMVVAWMITRISENLFIGFVSIFIVSLLSLMLIVGWFQAMTAEAAEDNIHWIFSYGLVLLLYPAYLFMNWFILKTACRVRAEE